MPEPSGAYCDAGGSRISQGTDSNGNGALDVNEITSVSLVCTVGSGTQTWLLSKGGATDVTANTGVIVDAGAANATLNLPANPAVNDTVRIKGLAAWKLVQRDGQSIDTKPLPGVPPDLTWDLSVEPASLTFPKRYVRSRQSSTGDTIVATYIRDFIRSLVTSVDGGRTWRPGPQEDDFGQFDYSVSPNGQSVVVTQLYATRISNDAGLSWTSIAHPEWNALNRFPIPYLPFKTQTLDGRNLVGVVYDRTNEQKKFFATSTDGGLTWATTAPAPDPVSPNQRDIYEIAISPDGQSVILTQRNGSVFASLDGGRNWTNRGSTTAPYKPSYQQVAYSGDGNTAFIATADGELYASTDKGQSWSLRHSRVGWEYGDVSNDGRRILARAKNEFGNDTLMLSDDGGKTWGSPRKMPVNFVHWSLSGDGKKLVLADTAGDKPLLISKPWTTRGAGGYVSGGAGTSIELRYSGDGNWNVANQNGSSFDAK